MLSADKTKAKSSKRKFSREEPIPSSTVEVADYRHKGEKRKNIPDAGLAIYNYKPHEPVKYSYDPHLDPQLVWTGKAERASFEVEAVSLHIHERVSTQAILRSVQRAEQLHQLRLFADPDLPLDKRIEFYRHEMDWANRLILGDSLLVMNSLKEMELLSGNAQMVYLDPPYGIAYNSNFQSRIDKRDVKDADEDLTREPEQIQAYRDTWELGIHSYLTYLRDRLLLARDLLSESGSIFVQISDENIHLVRCILDEIFKPQNFVALIAFAKTAAFSSELLSRSYDYLLWYARNKEQVKYRPLWRDRVERTEGGTYSWIQLPDGTCRRLTSGEIRGQKPLPQGRRFRADVIVSAGASAKGSLPIEFKGVRYFPSPGTHWKTTHEGMLRLIQEDRVIATGKVLAYKRFEEDFPLMPYTNVWEDTILGTFSEKQYVVQTGTTAVERCILMTTDPGDLVIDPTCGSGTTAYAAEKWGRRWITCDTSRVAISIARQRILTAKI